MPDDGGPKIPVLMSMDRLLATVTIPTAVIFAYLIRKFAKPDFRMVLEREKKPVRAGEEKINDTIGKGSESYRKINQYSLRKSTYKTDE